tara:strand:- start:78 stop:977 length:900 start_codon:yes stop_codon:yes gene_type:complete
MRIYFFFLALFLFIALFLSELYLKKIGLGDPVRYDSNILYGYAPKINQSKNRFKNSKVTINESGLRTIDNWKLSKKKKIVFLGDSVTYAGSYIDDKDTFVHKVCGELKNFICGNAGVNAYGIKNIVMRSKYDKRLQDAEIFIYLFPPGDFYREYSNSKTAHFYLNNKSFIFPAITEAVSFVATKYDINNYISKYDDGKHKNEDKIKLINYSISILADEIKNKKIKKKVFVFLSNEKNDKDLNSNLNKYIKENLVSEIGEINFLNNVLNDDKYFYDESVHFNEKGHKIVANEIIRLITEN